MLVGVVAWLLVSVFVFVLVFLTLLVVRSQRADVDFLLFTFLSIFYITLLMFVTGQLGMLRPIPLMILALAGLALLGMIKPVRDALWTLPRRGHILWETTRKFWFELPRWLQWLTIGFTILSTARFLFLILALPPFVWDSLTYHLTNVAQWTQQGEIGLFQTAVTRIYTPANYETLTLWFTVFLHHDAIIEAAGLPAYILGFLAVYSIGRSINISRSSAWLAGLVYLSTPALVIASTGTKNDPHMAAYYLALFALTLYLLKTGNQDVRVARLGPLLVTVLMVFLAFGTKAYWLHIAPGLLLVVALGVDQAGGWGRWREIGLGAIREWTRQSRWVRLFLVALVLAGLLLGLYWNLRNWALTGNPFYPYGVKVESAQVLTGAERSAAFTFDRLRENSASLFWKFGDRQARISPDLTDSTGWGWVVYGLGMPALLWGLIRRRDVRVLFVGFLVSLGLIFMSIRPSPWNMRYLLWFPAIFAIALGAFVDTQRHPRRLPVSGMLAMTVIGMSLNLLVVWNYGLIKPDQFARMLDLPLAERGSAQQSINMTEEYVNTLSIVPEEAVLGYNVAENGFIYPLYRPDYSQQLVYIPIDSESNCSAIAESMRARGTRYLFVAPVHTSDRVLGIMHACGEQAGVIRERSINLYVLRD